MLEGLTHNSVGHIFMCGGEGMTRLEHLELIRRDCLKALHEILAGGQVVTIEGMTLQRPSLEQVRGMLNDVENEIAELRRVERTGKGRGRMRIVVPV